MTPVILESPYAGDVERNERYAAACVRDCLRRNEAAFASHLYFTQPGLLDDGKPEERALGIRAGFAIASLFARSVIYTDLGISPGMRDGIADAAHARRHVEYRELGAGWDR
jgi:hypothetical protein